MASPRTRFRPSRRSNLTWPDGWSPPISVCTGRRMKRRSSGLIAMSGTRCGPLPIRALPRREQRLRRRVAHDAFVDVDTVRYSVPYRLVRDHVEVVVEEQRVRILHGATVIATHARSREPFARVIDPTHFAGLWRAAVTPGEQPAESLITLGRDLADYAAVVDGGE